MDTGKKDTAAEEGFRQILQIMARLRRPEDGCPWDLEQTFTSIVPHTIEEAYEVADAIESNDMPALKAELGDLLFQVIFYCQMACEAGRFGIGDVLASLNAKMIERHPHVFGDLEIADAKAQTDAWEAGKARVRSNQARSRGLTPSALDGVTPALPALTRAAKIQGRAARVGFDWPDAGPVLAKVREEVDELGHAMASRSGSGAIAEEIGDLFFSVVNLARHLNIDAESSLRAATRKFEGRFRRVEAILEQQGFSPDAANLHRMEAAWEQAKSEEKILTVKAKE